MAPKVYGTLASPPVRSTLITTKALGIDVEFQEVDILAQEQHKPEFLKLNPLHTIPTLQDGDFVIWDSHAINAYLVGKYGKDDSMYSKDLQKRAVIDQRLYFDTGVLFPRLIGVAASLVFQGANTINKEKAELLVEAYTSLETLLERSTYVAGEELSIADFSIISTITSSNVLVPVDASKFPKITAWIRKMQALPYYEEANQKGLDLFTDLVKSKLA